MGLLTKHVVVEGKRLTSKQWKESLSSNEGLFKRIAVPYYGHVVGPYVTESGQIQGDMEAAEQTLFHMQAAPYQQEFYDSLRKDNPLAAEEYLFTIIGATPVWKKDIVDLETLDKVLHTEQDTLKKDDSILYELKKSEPELFQRLPELLYKHFASDFNHLKERFSEMSDFQSHVKSLLEHLTTLEHKISSYLKQLRREKPFLFE